ncbi:hypothetical protein RRG08_022330 [Elysia crispata]|uniref:Reverse transcriptase n=1 Tax=Elysia crispata TaxID=231223 RepID=A0AAE1DS60_9GAST|nr:hypothetical protein RRG08_022330 [Elysia crispata]
MEGQESTYNTLKVKNNKSQHQVDTSPPITTLRSEQVLIFRLRTGHNGMNHDMFTKFKIGSTDQCPCTAGAMTAEHLLQTYPLYKVLRKRFWSQPTSLQNKLFGCLDDLRRTATFARETQATI